jgi:hypothetical protein
MTARERNANALRLRGCLLVLRKLNTDDPAAVKLTLARIRSTLRACQTDTSADRGGTDDKLVREIIGRMAKLAARA